MYKPRLSTTVLIVWSLLAIDAFLEFISTSEHRHLYREFLVNLHVPGAEHDSIRQGIEFVQVTELERLDPHPAPAMQGCGHPD